MASSQATTTATQAPEKFAAEAWVMHVLLVHCLWDKGSDCVLDVWITDTDVANSISPFPHRKS